MSSTTTTTTTTTDPMAWATPGTIALILLAVIVAILLIRYIGKRRNEATTTVIERPVAPPAHPTTPAPERIAEPVAVVPPVVTQPIIPPPVIPPVSPAPPPLADDIGTIDAAPEPTPGAAAVAAPAPVAATSVGDDLTRLKGVGPKLAAQLASLGYTSFAQIAALSPADAEALDAQLGSFKGRLTRDRWIEQAAYLAKGDVAGFEAAFGKL